MNRFFRLLALLLSLVTGLAVTSLAATKYLITNNNVGAPWENSASIFSVGSDGALTLLQTIPTKGMGLGASYFATSAVGVLPSKTNDCAYIGDSQGKYAADPGDVAAIDMQTMTLAGTFPGFSLDSGMLGGVGLAETPNGAFLFAAFSLSGTITTYQQETGCRLKRLSQIVAVGARNQVTADGAHLGSVQGMKVTPSGNLLILAYGDGSIGSYEINQTTGALTLIGRYLVGDGGVATGVDITADSKWALFGVATANGAEVEVAAIRENGTLGPTQGYTPIGAGTNSNNVWLSPDETILYIGNNSSGQITAVQFDKTTGVIDTANACTSAVLTNFSSGLAFLTGVSGSGSSPTGSPLYATASSDPADIITVNFTKPCMLTQSPNSPVTDPYSSGLYGVGEDPPRSF